MWLRGCLSVGVLVATLFAPRHALAVVDGCYLMENNVDFYLMENGTDTYLLEGDDGGACGGLGATPSNPNLMLLGVG